jgi:hypothetical protein
MISADEQHVEGWPLPATEVDLTESTRMRVAMFCRTGSSADLSDGTGPPRVTVAD